MTYLQFKEKNDIDMVLKKTSVIEELTSNFSLLFNPDYDSTDYEGFSMKDYVFFDKLDFEEEYFSVISVVIKDYGFIGIEDESSKEMFPDCDNLEKSLGDEGTFKKLDLIGVDNIRKHISLYGALRGDSFVLSGEMPVEPVAKLKLLVVPYNIEEMNFYYKLLAESRILFEEKKLKIAFFTAFSAFDMFINDEEENRGLVKLDEYSNVVNRRLEEKLKDIYKNSLSKSDLGRDKIWGELLSMYKKLEEMRNNIAHGRDIDCVSQDYQNLIMVIVSFILSITNSVDTFEKINNL